MSCFTNYLVYHTHKILIYSLLTPKLPKGFCYRDGWAGGLGGGGGSIMYTTLLKALVSYHQVLWTSTSSPTSLLALVSPIQAATTCLPFLTSLPQLPDPLSFWVHWWETHIYHVSISSSGGFCITYTQQPHEKGLMTRLCSTDGFWAASHQRFQSNFSLDFNQVWTLLPSAPAFLSSQAKSIAVERLADSEWKPLNDVTALGHWWGDI